MAEGVVGRVLAIALRSRPKGPMIEVEAATAVENGGLEGDVNSRPDRGMTFLVSHKWGAVLSDLDKELPWHTRRANVLVEAAGLAHLVGKTISLGEVEVRIIAESKPCSLMDRLEPGLRAALTPDCRGGVYGRIVRGGRFRVGDQITLHASERV